MWNTLMLCVLSLAAASQGALALKCGDVVNAKNETKGTFTFSGPPAGFEPGKACNLTVTRPKGNSEMTTVQLNMIDGAPTSNNTLEIYDGDSNVPLASFTATWWWAGGATVFIGFQTNMTFVFIPKSKTSPTTWSFDFNTEECDAEIVNYGYDIDIESPIYQKTEKKIELECAIRVRNLWKYDFIASASFNNFTLTGDSSLSVNAEGNPTYTEKSPLNDFIKQSREKLVLNLNITDTRTVQAFSLNIEPVRRDCSGVVSVNGSLNVPAKLSPLYKASWKCRWLVSAAKSPLLQAEIFSLRLPAVGGEDSLTFRVGGSSNAPVFESLVQSVDDYLVVTSEDMMVVTITIGSSGGERDLNITLMEAEYGGRMQDKGFLVVEDSPEIEEVFFSLTASAGHWVDVISDTSVTNGSTVSFYDGPQRSSPLLTQWSEESQDLTPVTGHEQMLVVVSNLVAGEKFNASFTSVPAGCDTLTSADSGKKTFQATSKLSKDQTCTWTVAPLDPVDTVVVSLSSVSLRAKESLAVTSGVAGSGQVLAQFMGPRALGKSPMPQVYVPGTQGFRVTFTRVAEASPSTSATVEYRTLNPACGGQLKEAMGLIETPNYPNQYPLNAACNWTVAAPKDEAASPLLLLSFSSLSLAQGHSLSVSQRQKDKSVQLASYGGMSTSPNSLPNDLILPGATDLTVEFSSQPKTAKPLPGSMNQVSSGINLNYWVLKCGGNLTTEKGSFQSPEFDKPPTKSALCVWILNVADVKGPKNSTNILGFNITAVGKDAKSIGQYVKIYDGPSLRSPYFPLASGRSNLSRYDSIVVVFNLTITDKSKPDVRLKFTYKAKNCNSSQRCDNRICMHEDWVCNGHDDCGDDSDEQNCVIPPPTPKPPKPAPPQSYSGWVRSGWVPGCLFIGIALGAAAVFFGPRVVRRLRGGRAGSYNRMSDPSV